MPLKSQGDPVAAILKLVMGFKTDVAQLVSGRPDDGAKGLIQIFRRTKAQFRETVFNQAPDFKPYERWQEKQFAREMEIYDGPTESVSPPKVSNSQEEEKLEPTGPRNSKTVVYLGEVLSMAQK